MKNVLVAEMSWKDFEEAMTKTDLVIIPMGVTEAHGLHNPLGTDTYIAEVCAQQIGEQLDVPVAPVMPFGYTPRVTGFAGTISLDPDLLRKVMFAYTESFVKHGARRFLFVNGHGGNDDLLSMVCSDLYDQYGCIATHTEWWEHLPQLKPEWPCDDHGGYSETSMMLAANSELVHLERAVSLPVNSLSKNIQYEHGWKYQGGSIPIQYNLYMLQKAGNVGQPPFDATLELGQEMMAAYVQFNVDLAKAMLAIDL